MKHLLLFTLFTLSTVFSNAQGWMWAKHFSCTGINTPLESIVDASGNIYVVGQFNGTISQGAFSLNVVGGLDGYIAKYNKNGQIQWLKQISGTGNEQPSSIALSNDGNYIYVSSNCFSNPTSFDGNNVATLGSGDICIAKFAIDGTFQWAHNSAFGADNQTFSKLTIDNSDNIILTGTYKTNITFYGEAVPHFSSASANFQTFISKFDNNGVFVWAIECPADNNSTYIRTVSVDATGYYFGGSWSGSLTLDVSVLSNAGNTDMFLYKTDYSGVGQWARRVMGSGSDILTRHKGDALGYQYITGYYNSPTLTIDSTTALQSVQTISNAGNNDIFYSCYAPDGTLQYTKTFGSTGDDHGQTIYASSDHVVLGGSYTGNIAFDSYNLTNDSTDAFMVETDKLGKVLIANKIAGKSKEICMNNVLSLSNRNYITFGNFYSDTLNIGGNQFLNPAGNRNAYATKWGCFDSLSFQSTPVNCIDGGGIPLYDDGTATVTPSEGSEPYTYVWSNGATTPVITGLGIGTYSVTVSGAYGCTSTGTVDVGFRPTLEAAITNVTNILCNGLSTGSATVTAVNGNPPYTYLWTNGITTPTISNVSAGTYKVTVTDQCYNEIVSTAVISEPSILSAGIFSQTNVSCNGGSDGSATVTVSGGVSPYTYLWNNPAPAQTTPTCTGLTSGTWRVTVTDANGCTSMATVNISQPSALASSIISKSNVTCNGGSNGSATVGPTGGTTPYTYLWNNPAPAQTTATCTGLASGTWSVTVTDNNSCTSVSGVTITQPSLLTVNTTQSDVSCFGGNDGTATATPSGGTPNYTYLWSDAQTTATATGLVAGNYTVTVTDANNCTAISSLTIAQPTALTATTSQSNVTCNNGYNGSATVNVTGGTVPYAYLWNNPAPAQTTSTCNSLTAGTWTVTVTDANGCTLTRTVNITQPTTINAYITSQTDVSCFGGSNGQATASCTGGSGTRTYLWNDPAPAQTSSTCTGLTAGVWNVTVTRSGSCGVAFVTITEPPVLTATITSFTDVACNGTLTGSATVSASGGTPNYSYNWSPNGYSGDGTPTYSNLRARTYTVTITDSKSCTASTSVIISQPSAISFATPTIICSVSSSNCTGSISAFPSGGVQPYSYSWSDPSNQTTQTAVNLCPNRYRVTVTDANGCTKTSWRWRVSTCVKSMSMDDVITDFDNNNLITLYPNPVSTKLSILVDSDEDFNGSTTVKIELYNLLGELVSSEQREINYGEPVLKDVSDYKTGLYLVSVIDKNERFTQRILIQR